MKYHRVYQPGLSSTARRSLWRELSEAWKHSGQVQRAFCEAQGVKHADFQRWLCRFNREAKQADAPTIPVLSRSLEDGFIPLQLNAACDEARTAVLSITHPSGFCVHYGPTGQATALAEVLDVIRGLSC